MFIAADAPEVATRFVRQLEDACTSLLTHPLLGPARDQLAPGLRVHFHRDYAIYYVPTEREIIVIRVLHGRRDRTPLRGRLTQNTAVWVTEGPEADTGSAFYGYPLPKGCWAGMTKPLLFLSHSGADAEAAQHLKARILATPTARDAVFGV